MLNTALILTLVCVAALISAATADTTPFPQPSGAEWVAAVAQHEEYLSAGLTLPARSTIGTHNSFNYHSQTAISIENPHNQKVDIITQLNDLNVRSIELDAHFIQSLPGSNASKVRVCHISPRAASVIRSTCDSIGWFLCGQFGLHEHDEDTGCKTGAPTLLELLGSVRQWINATSAGVRPNSRTSNPPFIIVFIDNFLNGQIDLLDSIIESVFGSSVVLRPSPLLATAAYGFPWHTDGTAEYQWPSVRNLTSQGKRVMFLMNHIHSNTGWAFSEYTVRSRIAISSFKRTDGCTQPPQFVHVDGDMTQYRLLGNTIFNPSSYGTITSEDAHQIRSCGYTVDFDLMDSSRLNSSLYSFSYPYPMLLEGSPQPESVLRLNQYCAVVVSGTDMRWQTRTCRSMLNPARHLACENETDPSHWHIGAEPTVWPCSESEECVPADSAATCPEGSRFSVPHGPLQQQGLMRAILSASHLPQGAEVWLRYQASVENSLSCWSEPGLLSTPAASTWRSVCTPLLVSPEPPASHAAGWDPSGLFIGLGCIAAALFVCGAYFAWLKKRWESAKSQSDSPVQLAALTASSVDSESCETHDLDDDDAEAKMSSSSGADGYAAL